MSEHEQGTMDINDHIETFNGFVKFVKWAVIVILAILIFLAIFAS